MDECSLQCQAINYITLKTFERHFLPWHVGTEDTYTYYQNICSDVEKLFSIIQRM